MQPHPASGKRMADGCGFRQDAEDADGAETEIRLIQANPIAAMLTADIPLLNEEGFRQAIDRLRKAAGRHAAGFLSAERISEGSKPFRRTRRIFVDGRWETVEDHPVLPFGTWEIGVRIPVFEGWTLRGIVDLKHGNDPSGEKAADRAPRRTKGIGIGEREAYAEVERRLDDEGRVCCDHCRTTRDRRRAFLFEREGDGTRQVVGAACAKDWLGVDAEKAIRWFESLHGSLSGFLGDLDFQKQGGGGFFAVSTTDWDSWVQAERAAAEARAAAPKPPLGDVLAVAIGMLRVSNATSSEALGRLWSHAVAATANGQEAPEEDRALAGRAIRWNNAMGYRSDDLWKVKGAAAEQPVDAWDDARNSLWGRFLRTWAVESGASVMGPHLGQPGDRVRFEAEILRTRSSIQQGYKGEQVVRIYRMRLDGGGLAAWETPASADVSEGQRWQVAGTVSRTAAGENTLLPITFLKNVRFVKRLDLDVGDDDAPSPDEGPFLR